MSKKAEDINWSKMIDEIQSSLIISQMEIASHCGCVRQSVSNWKIGYRQPGYHARRKLLELKSRSDIESKLKGNVTYRNKTSETVTDYSFDDSKTLSTISDIFKTLDALQKREVLEFIRFKAGVSKRG